MRAAAARIGCSSHFVSLCLYGYSALLLTRHDLAIVPPDASLRGLISLMPCHAAILLHLAMKPAPQYQPFVDARLEAGLVALVRLDVVGRDAARRAVNDVRFVEPALVDLLGCA